MEGITTGAAALSTYGLYFIVSILGYVSYRLYQKTGTLEKEFRAYMQKETTEVREAYARLLSDSTTALQASTAALKDSTEALNRIAIIMDRIKK